MSERTLSSAVFARRSVLLGTAAAVAASLIDGGKNLARAGGVAAGPWVVELFTSQGCSSCPPADAYLGKLAKRPDIVALSFHVDYWDYIGWKDPFASHETTERQRTYARVLKQRYVYTPEMVVDGLGDDAAQPSAIDALLAQAARRSLKRATPDLSRDAGGNLTIKLGAYDLGDESADVMLAIYDRKLSTKIGRGENGGHTLDNFNVVRRLETVSLWSGVKATWTVPIGPLQPGQGLAVMVQHVDQGPMIGANKLEVAFSG
jgi:hypothetical protein